MNSYLKIILIAVIFYLPMTKFGQIPVIFTFYGKDSIHQNLIALDSLYLKNLTENCDTLLYGPVPMLEMNASWPYGIDYNGNPSINEFLLKQNYPNPFKGSSEVTVCRNYKGILKLQLFEISGKILADYKLEMEPGCFSFLIASPINSISVLKASDERNSQSIKIINTGTSYGNSSINYLFQKPEIRNQGIKSMRDSGFVFFLGNQLMFTAYSNGFHENTRFDAPTRSTTYAIGMVPLNLTWIPSVTTADVTNITDTTAVCGGTVTSDGGAPVTIRGVCWDTLPNPTLADNYTSDGGGTGSFTSNLTGLSPYTTYYIKAYAINSSGTGYGNELMFSTFSLPVVSTADVIDITTTTATCGGNVISDGGDSVTARGVCWNTFPDPTIWDAHTTDGAGTGTFISQLTDLLGGMPYYVRSYATNSLGTVYGAERSFTTAGYQGDTCPGIPTVTYEGKTYSTVLIASQCWLRENLNVGIKIPGTQNQSDNGIKEKYCYNDIDENCNTYGGLYHWDELMQYEATAGSQGLCPPGWHLPSMEEWDLLKNNLGGSNVAGGKMKETGTAHWLAPNTGATNESGFTGLPGGQRYIIFGNTFWAITETAYFWTSTKYDPPGWPFLFTLNYQSASLNVDSQTKNWGLSARCLKD